MYEEDRKLMIEVFSLSFVIADTFRDLLRRVSRFLEDNNHELTRITPEQRHVLKEFCSWEIDTANLVFEDYSEGDHVDFLNHFIEKRGIILDQEEVTWAQETLSPLVTLPVEKVIVLLAGCENFAELYYTLLYVFMKKLPVSAQKEFDFFSYYSYRHSELDGGNEGHAEALSQFLDGSISSSLKKSALFLVVGKRVYQKIRRYTKK